MTTDFQSFDKSAVDAFVKSPLDARNAPSGKVLLHYRGIAPNGSFDESALIPHYASANGLYHGYEVHAVLDDPQYRWTGNIDDYAVVHLNYASFSSGTFPVPPETLFAGHRTIVYEDNQGETFTQPAPQRQTFASASGMTLGFTPGMASTPLDLYVPNQESISANGMALGFSHGSVYGNASGGTPLHVRPQGIPEWWGFNDMELVQGDALYVYLCVPNFFSVSRNPGSWPVGMVANYQTLARNWVGFGG